MSRWLAIWLAISVALGGFVEAARSAEPPPAATEAPHSGPIWWRIDNGGGSVLWVLGIPDGMIENFRWNDASLRKRLSAARLLINPLLGKPQAEPPPPCPDPCHWDYAIATTPGVRNQIAPIAVILPRTIGGNGGPNSPSPFTLKDPLSKTLPPDLARRAAVAVPLGGSDILNASPGDAALWLDLWNWPRGEELGNPVTDRALDLAQNQRLQVRDVVVPALWKPILVDNHREPLPFGDPHAEWTWLGAIRPNIRIVPPQDLQIKCLAQVLDQTETGQMPALRQAAMEAWATGDLDNALKRSNDVQYCLMGDLPSTSAKDFILNQAATYLSSLDHAFEAPGETVALVEFDPLLLAKGGVLDHYRSLGYDISQGDGMDAPVVQAPAN